MYLKQLILESKVINLLIGIDIGSTTVKVVVLDNQYNLLFKTYQRHYSKVREKTIEILTSLKHMLDGKNVRVALTGSGGMGVAKDCGLDFVQEVFATYGAVSHYLDDVDSIVELGGEDAKIIFCSNGLEERMNGSCAGGTGAFIDQMATLLNLSLEEFDKLSLQHERIYAIASRCGVFAKSDIQPLLNQGAKKSDLAASIFQAVVDQTIVGLAQGRRIEGKVVFLGGPLYFLKGLRERFVHTLKLEEENAIFPEEAAYFVAIGSALFAQNLEERSYSDVLKMIEEAGETKSITNALSPLFKSQDEYNGFASRHAKDTVKWIDIDHYEGDAYLGIDAGSTTTKVVLISANSEILYSYYASNKGNPLSVVKEQLIYIYSQMGNKIKIKGSAVTGYGEDLIKNAFDIDLGIVETIAHYRAARHFEPDVDFILDIGGQDIKCFRLHNGAIDSIMLNEACSSGCGSFIETYATALGYSSEEFAKLGLFAKHPVDLGSRCTVFMNSSIKQAQKEGAGVEDISAGLSYSVVKNAIYKVIRETNPSKLGKKIVVQGGTFLNDAVLRSFELELGLNVTRPTIAGIMGAYGAALLAKDAAFTDSHTITFNELENFIHKSKSTDCGLCGNHCHLTINIFSEGKKFISGNKCERPNGGTTQDKLPNLYKFKYNKLREYKVKSIPGKRGKLGLPLGLNMYENLPFWHTFFTHLGFEVIISDESSRDLYISGKHTMPSDTVCYPAKLLHGHIENLIEKDVQNIFYPCLPYNFDEKMGDNHYNCPVVAYYPELLDANIAGLKDVNYMCPYFGLHRPKDFVKSATKYFEDKFDFTKAEIKKATQMAYEARENWHKEIRLEGEKALAYAKEHQKRIIILAGRPYHIDPEINHGIDTLITSLGMVIISEDAIAHEVPKQKVNVLNQWTYHSRLYAAAAYVKEHKDMELVQLVSFGCGLDAITGDEIREQLEIGDKLYTQLKIDEISNLGAAKIRLRSLIAAMDARQKE